MVKVLFIIAQRNYRDEELQTPKKLLEENNYPVDVASITTDVARGMLGGNIKPDLSVKEALKKDYAGVVVVGGSGAPELASNEEVIEILKSMADKRRLVASICLGPVVLAKAGVLQGKRATVWSSSAYQQSVRVLKEHGARYIEDTIVIDGNIITAFGPDFAHKFGEELVSWLDERTG